MKYFFVAGEASGDLHASTVMEALTMLDTDGADFAYMGGAKMRALGGDCVLASESLAYMGVVDVVKNISKISKAAKVVQQALLRQRPDVVVCVDYAGFCFRYILPFVREHLPHTKIAYYIPPKVWAWKKGRIKTLRSHTDRVLSIFPFEVPFFNKHQLPQVTYVGNPTLEEVDAFIDGFTPQDTPSYIAILPGSRRSEVVQNLPTMLRVALSYPDMQVKIAGTSSLDRGVYGTLPDRVELVIDDTYSVVRGARAALVTSGTATLETALLGTPQVVCYAHKAGMLANMVFNRFFTTPFISLVNLVACREVVKELYGGLFTEGRIWSALCPLLSDSYERAQMLQGYDEVRATLMTNEPSSLSTAKEILNLLT